MSRNGSLGETDFADVALDCVRALLPASWQLTVRPKTRRARENTGAVVELIGPGGETAVFAVEAKRSGTFPVPLLLMALRERGRSSGLPVLFASDYIGPTTRDALAADDISYADATGWVRVMSDDPLILLTGLGAERSPRSPRQVSAVIRINGVAANRIVRALAAADLPTGVRTLAGLAGASPGSVSKLLVTLTAEGVVDRDEAGTVTTVRRRALIRRWANDYAFTKSNLSVRYCIAPRGLDRALASLADQADVALTGSAAARRLLPESVTSVVPLRQLTLYAADPDTISQRLKLIDADPATANVIVARPQDPAILKRSAADGEFVLAPPPLVLADLLTLPGRSDAEAQQLMDVLASADPAWAA